MRYSELANVIVKHVTDGTYAVGEQLPSERELAEHYGVSRSTVRAALDVVERLGLVTRKRRAGTVVSADRPSNVYARSVSSIEDLVSYASHTSREVLGMHTVVADPELAAHIECKPGSRWLRIRMLRTENDDASTPLCWNDAYIEHELGESIAALVKNGTGLLSHLIEEETGVTVARIKQTVGATELDDTVAARLGVPAGSSGLEIIRSYLDSAGHVFLVTVNLYPAQRYRFSFWMERGP